MLLADGGAMTNAVPRTDLTKAGSAALVTGNFTPALWYTGRKRATAPWTTIGPIEASIPGNPWIKR